MGSLDRAAPFFGRERRSNPLEAPQRFRAAAERDRSGASRRARRSRPSRSRARIRRIVTRPRASLRSRSSGASASRPRRTSAIGSSRSRTERSRSAPSASRKSKARPPIYFRAASRLRSRRFRRSNPCRKRRSFRASRFRNRLRRGARVARCSASALRSHRSSSAGPIVFAATSRRNAPDPSPSSASPHPRQLPLAPLVSASASATTSAATIATLGQTLSRPFPSRQPQPPHAHPSRPARPPPRRPPPKIATRPTRSTRAVTKSGNQNACKLGSMRVALSLFGVVLSASHAALADTKAECVAASEKAQQLRDDRKLIEARDQFLACARDACPAAVKKDCADQIADVNKRTPSVVVRQRERQKRTRPRRGSRDRRRRRAHRSARWPLDSAEPRRSHDYRL